jgi:PAS domain S-box-containing protein
MTKREHGKRKSMKTRPLLQNPERQTDLFQKTFNSAKAAIFVLDSKVPPLIIECNRAASEIFGYKKSEMVGRTTAFLHASDESLRKFQAQLYPAIEKQEYFNLDYRMKRKDGSAFPSDHTVTPLLDDHGQRIGWVSVITGIAEREHADEIRSNLAAIVESSDDAIVGKTLDGVITSWNRGAENLYGYSAEEVKGKPISILIPPNRPDELAKILERIKRGERVQHYETRRLRKDGTIIEVSLAVSPIRDSTGGIVGASTIARDITERTHMQKALQESEEKYRAMVENSPSLIGIFQDGVLKYVNSVAILNLGWTYEELVSPSFDPIENVVSQKSRSLLKENVDKNLRGEDVDPYEISLTRKDGSEVLVLATGARIIYNQKPAIEFVFDDITERKRMERELRQGEERYRLITENMPGSVWLMDMNLKPTYISPNNTRVRGYTLEELYALPLDRQLTPDSLKLALENFKKALSEENLNSKDAPRSVTEELEFYRKDGSTFWSESTFSFIRNSKGEPVGILGVGRDITARKWAEEKLRQSEERYRSLFDRTLDGMYRSTHEGRFVDVNLAFVKMFEYSSKQEMLDITDIKKELYFSAEERGSHLLDTGHEEVEAYRMKRKDGSEIWVEDHGHYVHDEQGNIIYHEGILRDITERKRAEEASSRLVAIVESSDDAIISKTLDGVITSWNQSAERLYGYSAEEAMGKLISILIPPDQPDEVEQILEKVKTGERVQTYRTQRMRKNGEVIDVSLTVSPIKDPAGKTIGASTIARDITERKRMEDRLMFLHEHALRLVSAKEMNEIVKYTLDAMESTLGFDNADFWLVGDGSIYVQDSRGKPFQVTELRISGPSVIVKAARTKNTLRIPDTRTEPAFLDDPATSANGEALHMMSELAVPVLVSNETAAILNVENTGINAFTEQDQRLLETLASHVASALNRLRQQDELRRYSEHLEELVGERTRQLSESEVRFRELANLLPQIVFEIDQVGNYTFVNRSGIASAGYTEEEVLSGLNALQTFIVQDRVRIKENIGRILTGEDLGANEYTALRKDGTTFPVMIHSTPIIRDGKPVGLRGIAMDITERKRMEDSLRESERRFREMTDLLPNTVFELDLNGKFTFMNPAGLKVIGYDEGDLKSGLSAFQVVAPEDHDALRENIRRILNGGPSIGHEFVILRKDGSRFPEIAYASPIIKEGRAVGLRGVVVDITERKRLEERLAEANRFAAIGETAAMVGHDLRNPLQGIAGALHLLKQESLTAEERNEMLQVIEKSVHYSDAIIKDLSDYSAEIKLKLAEATPRSITRDAIGAFKVPQNVTIQDSSGDQPTLRVDPDRMRRVFINLIENAIDAMPQGGTLTISSWKSDGNVEIALTDTGSGMSEKVMENLWKPLQTTKAKGLGLGLAICRRIVDAHGGSISVKSEAGNGTTLTIQLPVRPVEVKRK